MDNPKHTPDGRSTQFGELSRVEIPQESLPPGVMANLPYTRPALRYPFNCYVIRAGLRVDFDVEGAALLVGSTEHHRL